MMEWHRPRLAALVLEAGSSGGQPSDGRCTESLLSALRLPWGLEYTNRLRRAGVNVVVVPDPDS